MFSLLVKLFIKDKDKTKEPAVRRKYATLSGIYGIFLNVILFIAKYIAGSISGSLAVIADAFNNLSDAGSSVITLAGFALAGKKPDKKHPFGHGRMEYLTGFIISAIIIVVGVELGISSVKKIITPEPVETGIVSLIILAAAILIKFYMFIFNRKVGRKINSEALLATAADSIADCVATAVALISLVIGRLFDINIDGWAGLLVALFVLYTGITSVMETVSPLMGKAPDAGLVKGIEETVKKYPYVTGIHDLIVHDYGPGRLIISLHAEVAGDEDIYELHDSIDSAERELEEKYGCLVTIHMDPIETKDEKVNQLRKEVEEKVKEAYPEASIHDFRVVPSESDTKFIFDTLLPADFKEKDEDAEKKICDIIKKNWQKCSGVIHIDRSYI